MNNFKKIAADAAQKYTNLQEGWNDRMDDPNTTPEQMRDRADMARERAKDQPTAQKPKPKKSTYTLGFQGKSKTMTVKKEEVEQMDEVNFADVVARQKEKYGGKLPDKYPAAKKTASNLDVGTSKASKVYSGKPQHKDVFGHDTKSQSAGATGPRASIMQHAHNKIKKFFSKEEYEQIDEVSKKTLGSYIKAASHDVAAKGAFTRHFADKSRAETAAQRPDLARMTMKKADKMQDAGMKRRANMAKAVDRLTKKD